MVVPTITSGGGSIPFARYEYRVPRFIPILSATSNADRYRLGCLVTGFILLIPYGGKG